MLSSVLRSSSLKRFFATSPSAPIIGIDLGTTNSCVAVVESSGKSPTVLDSPESGRTTPSVVAFTKDGQRLVGGPAKRQQVMNGKSTFFATKRLIGRRFEDESVKRFRQMVPFEVVRADNSEAWVRSGWGQTYSPAQIGAAVLDRMKTTAESYLRTKVAEAVVTVPAYFNDSQRQATRDAAKIAGLTLKRIINEPTAAALAYGIESKRRLGQTVAVFDLGGGTFDISILEIGKDNLFQVKATNGDTFLGGEDFDGILVEYLLNQFKKVEGIDLRGNHEALERIREAAEKAKCELSSLQLAEVNLPYITVTPAGAKHLRVSVTRAEFERLTAGLIARTVGPVRSCLKDAKLTPQQVNEVILVGGMTRMPKVIASVQEFFGRDPFRGVNPDEVVAVGAAIQGDILRPGDGKKDGAVLLDVIPLSLGIETVGGVFTPLIERNTLLPTRKSQVFSTATDGQRHVEIKVYQGEREMCAGNKLLGEFTLVGIPPAPRGVPKIEVSFDVDANSILNVSATDKSTGKEQKIKIENHGGLSQEEIEKFLADQQKYAEADRKEKARVERRIQVEEYALEIEKQLTENEKKLPVSFLSEIRKLVSEVREVAKGTDEQAITEKYEALKKESLAMYEHINKAGQTATEQPKDAKEEEKKTEDKK
jgi:molecular chaperone DnaK